MSAKSNFYLIVVTFVFAVLLSIAIKSFFNEDNVYNNCNQEETNGIDIDIEDLDIYINENECMDLTTTSAKS